MIRIHIVRDANYPDGGMVIYITGHANEKVCAGISAIVQTAIGGLIKIAREYPTQAYVDGITTRAAKRRPRRR